MSPEKQAAPKETFVLIEKLLYKKTVWVTAWRFHSYTVESIAKEMELWQNLSLRLKVER